MMRYVLIFIAAAYANMAASSDINIMESLCKDQNVKFVPLQIDANDVIRRNVPSTLFGFHHPWYDFQVSYFKDDRVNNDVLTWLKPFYGAAYRFPGGNEYDWKRAAEPLGQMMVNRKKMKARYSKEGFVSPRYGLPEFVEFIEQVNGKAIIMLNLVGPDGKLLSEAEMIQHNIDLVNWFRNSSAWRCSSGNACPILYWELGNELDWPDTRWSAEQYINRAEPLINALKILDPNIALAVLGKTSPWDNRLESTRFNQLVASKLANKVAAVTLHPYYDGLPIPVMTEWMNRTLSPYQQVNAESKIVITEHGRWPTQKSVNWADDWYKASGSGGAISTADFIISVMGMPEVDVAAWHALSALGPWQLFHYNKKSNKTYPSAVYWALRVLRDSFLQSLINVSPSKVIGSDYVGGYDLNVGAMKDSRGRISVFGVNRSKNHIQLSFFVENNVVHATSAKIRYLTADERGSDNTDDNTDKHIMREKNIESVGGFVSGWCVPPLTVFSIVQ